jgi:CRP-like cAMP-binding protein
MQRDHLQQVPFFAGLPKKELDLLARQTDDLDVAPGKVLAREGDFGDEFFVIESGSAEVTRGGEQLRELGAGDFFGELALLDEDRRTATVTATSPMEVIVMTRSNFRALDREMPDVHASVIARIKAYR